MMIPREQVSAGIEYLERPARSGPVFVLLHGIGSNAGAFMPLLDHLPSDWRVIAWNAPGYGRSRPLDAEWPLALDYAAALRGFLDSLELDRIILVGHSLGCLIGAAFAAAHGDRVARLLLSSPALGHGVPRGAALSPASQARIDDLAKLGPEDFAKLRAARLVHEPERNPQIVDRVRDAMACVTMDGYRPAVRMLASGRLLDDAERLQVQTDLIVGQGDLVTPPESAQRAHAAVHSEWRGSLTLVPEAGHALYQQAPAAFAAALGALVETAD
jgi:pimeloyl-ACP methyl ester carboxylesterase